MSGPKSFLELLEALFNLQFLEISMSSVKLPDISGVR